MCIRDSFKAPLVKGAAFPKRMGKPDEYARLALAIIDNPMPVSYTHLRAHETVLDLVCRLLLEKKKKTNRSD